MSKLLAIALLGLTFLGTPALADEVAAVTISNPNSVAINYQVRLNDGAWESKMLPAGYDLTHSWVPAYGDRLTIRFDCIGSDGQVTDQYYNLPYNLTHFPEWGGRPYVFQYSYDGHYLDLKSE